MFLSVREVMPTGSTDMGCSYLQDVFTVIPAEAGIQGTPEDQYSEASFA